SEMVVVFWLVRWVSTSSSGYWHRGTLHQKRSSAHGCSTYILSQYKEKQKSSAIIGYWGKPNLSIKEYLLTPFLRLPGIDAQGFLVLAHRFQSASSLDQS